MQIGFTDPWWRSLPEQWPVTIRVVQGFDWTDVVSLLLTAALVYFARAEIQSAKLTRLARERAAGIRVSKEAYDAQQTLALLLARFPRSDEITENSMGAAMQWASSAESPGGLAFHMNNLIVLAAEASKGVIAEIQDAYIKYRKGQEEAVACTASWRRDNHDLHQVDAHARAAQSFYTACSERLAKVIDRDLLHQTLRPSVAHN